MTSRSVSARSRHAGNPAVVRIWHAQRRRAFDAGHLRRRTGGRIDAAGDGPGGRPAGRGAGGPPRRAAAVCVPCGRWEPSLAGRSPRTVGPAVASPPAGFAPCEQPGNGAVVRPGGGRVGSSQPEPPSRHRPSQPPGDRRPEPPPAAAGRLARHAKLPRGGRAGHRQGPRALQRHRGSTSSVGERQPAGCTASLAFRPRCNWSERSVRSVCGKGTTCCWQRPGQSPSGGPTFVT